MIEPIFFKGQKIKHKLTHRSFIIEDIIISGYHIVYITKLLDNSLDYCMRYNTPETDVLNNFIYNIDINKRLKYIIQKIEAY
jgi:hypothetical protein